MARDVGLLRGINVGGKNLICMADLKACFERGGFDDVATYIQSGNVLFTSGGANGARLTERIERMLAVEFDHDASVVLRSGFAARASRSRLSRIVSWPVSPGMTIRTWRTTRELLRLLEGEGLSRRAP